MQADSYWKWSWPLWLVFLAIVAGLSYASWDSLVRMEYLWDTREEFGYAYIIPAVTAYFIWQRHVELMRVEFRVSWPGAAGVLAGGFLILLGVLSATHSITQYGYVLAIVSTVWFFMGWNAFRIILGPLLLLFLAVPLPNFILNNLSADLQLISSEIGVAVIRAFGISVYLEGNVIDLGKYQLQVVEACSGLRYLFPLISLSVIAAFLYQAAAWKRAVVILSSIPITVLMNSFRIGMIGILVEHFGIEQAEGFLHDFEGWIVFMACVAILLLEMWLLVAFGKNKQSLAEVFAIEAPEELADDIVFKPRRVAWQHISLASVVVVLGFVIGALNERDEIIPDRQIFAGFPLHIEDWQGRRDKIEKIYLDELKLDDYIIADYVDGSGRSVNLYLAYYASQRSGSAAHSPKSCIPGGGWRIKSHDVIDVAVGSGQTQPVNRLLIQKGEYGQLVYYWFRQRGRIITNEYMVKWLLFWDSMNKGRTDGALVRLTTVVQPGEDLSRGESRLRAFMQQINPLLPEYIPD